MIPKHIRTPRAQPLLLSQVRHGVWWDGVQFGSELVNSERLFGNARVGYYNLTNLVSGGRLNAGYNDNPTVILQRWFARTTVIGAVDERIVDDWAGNTVATMSVNHHMEWQLHVSELLARRPRYDIQPTLRRTHDPWPLVIPPHADTHVTLDMFYGTHDLVRDRFQGYGNQLDPEIRRRPTVWIVLEGLVVPTAAVEGVLAILAQLRQQHVAAHVEIVEYLRRIKAAEPGPAEEAILEIVVDGILQNKAML